MILIEPENLWREMQVSLFHALATDVCVCRFDRQIEENDVVVAWEYR